jgi:hypothetical protein
MASRGDAGNAEEKAGKKNPLRAREFMARQSLSTGSSTADEPWAPVPAT